ncbi:MAG: hypothetical protein JWM10_184, partial [Myxococcaceae bacterium]|nr:hypothetical protein [Myxococcaceae bacterium]
GGVERGVDAATLAGAEAGGTARVERGGVEGSRVGDDGDGGVVAGAHDREHEQPEERLELQVNRSRAVRRPVASRGARRYVGRKRRRNAEGEPRLRELPQGQPGRLAPDRLRSASKTGRVEAPESAKQRPDDSGAKGQAPLSPVAPTPAKL